MDSDNPVELETAGTATQMKPRDAATLIVVDSGGNEPKVLMGRRHPGLIFMPGKYVFPGGRVDDEDRTLEPADDLRAAEFDKLLVDMRGRASISRARALAVAAIRETCEEVGLLIAGPANHTPATQPAAPPATWRDFIAQGRRPSLAGLTLLARAITPPGRTRRFDARFFGVSADAITDRLTLIDGELLDVRWLTLEEARGTDLASITRVVLEDLADRLKAGAVNSSDWPVPFYHYRNGRFMRDLLTKPAKS